MLPVEKQRVFAEWQTVPGQREIWPRVNWHCSSLDVNWDGVGSCPGHGDVAAVPARVSSGVVFNGGNGPWQ